MKFKELQQLLNDVDSIEHGDDEIRVGFSAALGPIEFEIVSLIEHKETKIWYLVIK